MEFRDDVRYARTHEWARREGDVVVCGISDYAQDSLGDVVFVQLPEVGVVKKRGEAFGVVESVKTTSDVHMPVSGKIVEINETLKERPDLLNTSPFEEGWLVKVQPTDPAELDELLSADDYRKYVEEEE
ncbi:Glycine cleavage system H protein [Spirochaeta thermophila DSM 6578]|uniref:Glycine cleavage system H protein n=1 Tax=Winmispira thermophila (strain ATCC 700085 / DSM 6578 / Z-1203) TaxID=869211 RepID=G0GAZ5_WINT7|nr:glycine cleavage system protein GcvH [Spirochaeta thermophila]AEJ60297.1 Glycine cleavage system H protein [Spirochaeta thermophila DSM 6578]